MRNLLQKLADALRPHVIYPHRGSAEWAAMPFAEEPRDFDGSPIYHDPALFTGIKYDFWTGRPQAFQKVIDWWHLSVIPFFKGVAECYRKPSAEEIDAYQAKHADPDWAWIENNNRKWRRRRWKYFFEDVVIPAMVFFLLAVGFLAGWVVIYYTMIVQ